MQKLLDIGYAMGLFVGESHFATDRSKPKPRPSLAVKLHADDPEPLQFLFNLFGGKIFGPYRSNGRHFRVWRLDGKALSKVLPLLNRYLPVSRKRRQFEKWVQIHKFEGLRVQLQMELCYVEHPRRAHKKSEPKVSSGLLKFEKQA